MKNILKLTVSFIIGLLFGGIGIWIGISLASGMSFADIQEKFATIDGFRIAGVALLSIVLTILTILLQVILHEGGHLVFGLATGYRFVSFRIFNLTILRLKGKLCIKRFGVAGTGGQCLLTPPDKPLQDIPCVWYNMGGVIANLLTAVIAIILLLTIDGMAYPLKLFLLLFCGIGILAGLTNGIPMKIGGIGNDAYNMRLLLKKAESKRATMQQLRINALIQEGVRPKDIPEEWFHLEKELDYKDSLQVGVRLMAASRLQDLEVWDEAYNIFEEMMDHKDKIIGLYVKEIACELLFTSLLLEHEQAIELYTDEQRTYIQQYKSVMSSKQRILCAIALYLEKDAPKAKEIYETVCNQKDKYLMQGEVNMDIALMKSFLTAGNVL